MRALWKKYFAIPTDAPIGDRVFMARLTMHVCLILWYLFCMAYVAFVLFYSSAATVY